jgi:hypothetical protein
MPRVNRELTDLFGAESKLLDHARNDARARRLTDALAGETSDTAENEAKLRFAVNTSHVPTCHMIPI